MEKKRQGERDPGASVLAKLRNHAKATREEVPTVLARYINERFLYRLSLSPYAERFVLRDTPFPPAGLPIALTAAFSTDPTKQGQWERFAKKGVLRSPPLSLEATVAKLTDFLQPLLIALANERPFLAHWKPGGPWEL